MQEMMMVMMMMMLCQQHGSRVPRPCTQSSAFSYTELLSFRTCSKQLPAERRYKRILILGFLNAEGDKKIQSEHSQRPS
jgi:hypothetical protein